MSVGREQEFFSREEEAIWNKQHSLVSFHHDSSIYCNFSIDTFTQESVYFTR